MVDSLPESSAASTQLQSADLLYHFTVEPADVPSCFHGPYQPPPALLRQARTEWLQRQRNAFWMSALVTPQGGKMFGILVVSTPKGLRYLAGYSGKLAKRWDLAGFVPPIFDLGLAGGVLDRAEQQLLSIEQQIEQLTSCPVQRANVTALQVLSEQSQTRIASLRQLNRERRQERAKQRTQVQDAHLLATLDRQSQQDKANLKRLRQTEATQLGELQSRVDDVQQTLTHLRQQRAEISQSAQNEHFAGYRLLNDKGEERSLSCLCAPDTPSGGAGDCAAPKLLQYAWKHQLQPLALAEFWLGSSPAGEIRHPRRFYPPCRSRCAPLLRYMLPAGKGTNPDSPYVLPSAVLRTAPVRSARLPPLTVLFEDDYLLAVDKPTGMLSATGRQTGESVNILMARQLGLIEPAVEPAHRLDMDTSGILLLAKSPSALAATQRLFERRSVSKRYIAILDGHLERTSGHVDLPLRVDLNDRPRQVVCAAHGKSALTRYRVVERSSEFTRVVFKPITGRTHQLRVHAAHREGLAMPILGDPLYGCFDDEKNADPVRMHLHADRLSFVHPITQQPIRIVSPAPF